MIIPLRNIVFVICDTIKRFHTFYVSYFVYNGYIMSDQLKIEYMYTKNCYLSCLYAFVCKEHIHIENYTYYIKNAKRIHQD